MTSRRRPPRTARPERYSRSARINQVLQEVVAEELERLADADERLRLLTVTGVVSDPDLRQAQVLMSRLDQPSSAALSDARIKLQAAISRQVRIKRTPLLSFAPDPAIAAGGRIDEILRRLSAGEVGEAEP